MTSAAFIPLVPCLICSLRHLFHVWDNRTYNWPSLGSWRDCLWGRDMNGKAAMGMGRRRFQLPYAARFRGYAADGGSAAKA